jgi:hypothetical protein
MNYAVEWLPSVLVDLADLWTNGPDRAAITAAANDVDARLARDPLSQGEGREGATRILFVEPLAVLFEVDTSRRRVTVFDIWRWPT